MPSPFPGMDPYLEAHWRDVHSRPIIYSCDQLQSRLPSDLRARVEERVLIDSPPAAPRAAYPDVRVVETGRPCGPAPGTAIATLPEPLLGPDRRANPTGERAGR